MELGDWRQECLRLQAELDAVRAEMEDYKVRWERLMQFKDAPRLPLRGRTDKLTTVGWQEGDDLK